MHWISWLDTIECQNWSFFRGKSTTAEGREECEVWMVCYLWELYPLHTCKSCFHPVCDVGVDTLAAWRVDLKTVVACCNLSDSQLCQHPRGGKGVWNSQEIYCATFMSLESCTVAAFFRGYWTNQPWSVCVGFKWMANKDVQLIRYKLGRFKCQGKRP